MCQRKSSKTHFTSLVANQVSRSLGRSREFAMTRTQTLIPFRLKKKNHLPSAGVTLYPTRFTIGPIDSK